MSLWEMALKLMIAALLGGAIGFEREAHERPAGLRTHILVCMGAALFALSSFQIAGEHFDPGRVTAQIVTGIGFLGAGTILRRGSVVRGLTTAASIWIVAAIGIAVAIGGTMLYLALIASALVIGTLTLARVLDRFLPFRHSELGLTLTIRDDRASLGSVVTMLGKRNARVVSLASEEGPEGGQRMFRAHIQAAHGMDRAALDAELAACQDVISYNWD